MANSMFGDSLWAFVVVGGFIILGLAIAFAKMRNRVSAREDQHSEDATRELYAEQDRADKTGER